MPMPILGWEASAPARGGEDMGNRAGEPTPGSMRASLMPVDPTPNTETMEDWGASPPAPRAEDDDDEVPDPDADAEDEDEET